MKTVGASLCIADGYNGNVKVNTAAPEHEAIVCLAAEVRRLRNEIDQLRCQLAGCGVAALENTVGSRSSRAVRGDYGYSASYEYVCNAVDREISLREENAALRADADRIDWLADVNNTVGSVVLPREIVEANVSSLRQAIDAARIAPIGDRK